MKKKNWKKPVGRTFNVGVCRYCKKSMTSDESFVAFLSTDKNGEREKAHYQCMKEDDEKSSGLAGWI